jgi:redox-sensitive bicupin YhaK (pirin superfamily)
VHTFTPLLGAQIDLDPGVAITFDVDEAYEHGVLVDQGDVEACGSALAVADLAYQGTGHDQLELVNRGDSPARLLLLGGTPFTEELVMWWNFVGRSHDEIVAYREQWQNGADRFGAVQGYDGPVQHLPAPPLPNATLRPRPIPGV